MSDLYVFDKDGKKRRAVAIHCKNCGKEFLCAKRFVESGRGKFCSIECKGVARRTRVNMKCAWCGNQFSIRPSQLKNSKSGLYFCKRSCKDAAQKIGGIVEIMPPHYGTSNGEGHYREQFTDEELICKRCGYHEFISAVDIHHIDKDRTNNDKKNLIPLCSNCHKGLHYGLWKLEELGS
jgi:hypothetical protein